MSHFSLWSHFSDTLIHENLLLGWCLKQILLPTTSTQSSQVPEDEIISDNCQPEVWSILACTTRAGPWDHHKKDFVAIAQPSLHLIEDREQGGKGQGHFGCQGTTGSRVKQAGHRWHKGTSTPVPGSLPSLTASRQQIYMTESCITLSGTERDW